IRYSQEFFLFRLRRARLTLGSFYSGFEFALERVISQLEWEGILILWTLLGNVSRRRILIFVVFLRQIGLGFPLLFRIVDRLSIFQLILVFCLMLMIILFHDLQSSLQKWYV